MRYVVGMVVGLAMVASPVAASAQEDQVAPLSWLESELAALLSAQQQGAVTSVDRLQIALIPEHLQQRRPGYTKPPPETKPPGTTSETQPKRLSKGGIIAIGVIVPLAVVAIAAGAFVATFEL